MNAHYKITAYQQMGLLLALLSFAGVGVAKGQEPSYSTQSSHVNSDIKTEKCLSKKRSSQHSAPISIIPLSKIKPFLTQGKILPPNQDKRSWPSIKAIKGEHLIIGKGDMAYSSPMSHPIGTRFDLCRLGKKYTDPITQAHLGTEAEIIGEALLVGLSSTQLGTLKILTSYRDIHLGDLLMPASHETTHPYFTLKYPSDKQLAEGEIINVSDGVSQIGQYQVVTITGGKNRGRRVGDMLTIVHQATNPERILPKEKVGELFVIGVFDLLSHALVAKTTQPIYLHDTVESP